MAKSDLLKQAIADANAVKETALANAKIALQEAFTPRIQSMLGEKLRMELEGEEDVDATEPTDMGDDVAATGDETLGGNPEQVKVGLDFNDDGDWDLEGTVGAEEEMPADEMPEEEPAQTGDEMNAEYNEGYAHEGEEDLELESIIRELEAGLESEDETAMMEDGYNPMDEMEYTDEPLDENIDSIIEAILREEDEEMMEPGGHSEEEAEKEMLEAELESKEQELQEAYSTVKKLTNIINEVNLLNAKLLYTNKLFRNFELSEGQKMKVIENFDRAGNTREVKLVFSTLAESFKRPETKKRVVKESYASKATQTTAPKTNTILNEGFELADRWKKLAGLL